MFPDLEQTSHYATMRPYNPASTGDAVCPTPFSKGITVPKLRFYSKGTMLIKAYSS